MGEETQTNPQGNGEQTPPKYEKYEDWIATQDESVRQLIDTHTSSLKSALQKERDDRAALAKQLREVLPQAEQGSKASQQITQLVNQLEEANRRITFAETAIQPEIGCRNPKAAFAVAVQHDLFTRSGEPDWKAIKAEAPELFGKPTPASNGGAGNQLPPTQTDMNTVIRRLAGRGTTIQP